jgi:hypothetical protein
MQSTELVVIETALLVAQQKLRISRLMSFVVVKELVCVRSMSSTRVGSMALEGVAHH